MSGLPDSATFRRGICLISDYDRGRPLPIRKGRLISEKAFKNNQGFFVDREKLVAAGKERFEKLLELGHAIRRFGIGLQIELTNFSELCQWCHGLFRSPVPPLTADQKVRGESADLLDQFDQCARGAAKRRDRSGKLAQLFLRGGRTNEQIEARRRFSLGGSITTCAKIRGGQSSLEVTDGRRFAGCCSIGDSPVNG